MKEHPKSHLFSKLFLDTFYSLGTQNVVLRASLVVQWLRICLPMQGTRVRALVWEDPTCCGATGPVSRNYWACTSGACAPPTREAAIVRGLRTAMRSGPHLPQLEKALAQKRRPNTAKNKLKKKKSVVLRCCSSSIAWKSVRNAEPWAAPESCWIRNCGYYDP